MLQSETCTQWNIHWLWPIQLCELNQHGSEMEIRRIVENDDKLPTTHSTYSHNDSEFRMGNASQIWFHVSHWHTLTRRTLSALF